MTEIWNREKSPCGSIVVALLDIEIIKWGRKDKLDKMLNIDCLLISVFIPPAATIFLTPYDTL